MVRTVIRPPSAGRVLQVLSRRAVLLGGLASPLAQAERRLAGRAGFEVTQRELRLTSLDAAHDGLRVAQLSDLHLGWGVPPARVLAAIRAVNALQPDLVVLTGDFITTRRDPVSLVPEVLGHLERPPVAVLGNHDHWTYPAELTLALERLGIPVLRNQVTTLRLKAADFSVIGVDDSTTRHDDVGAAFQGAPRGSRLVLTHTPACAGRLPEGQDLPCFSGHTHGGQVVIPGLTDGLFKAFGQPWYRGAYQVRGNQLYVNRGLGFGRGTPYPRANSEPEVTLFTLRHRPLDAEPV